jgi:CHASE2 domain-containing sensor protein
LIPRIDSYEYGGYRDLDAAGSQMLLNYREPKFSLREIAPHYAMEDVRNGRVSTKVFEGKIVLIGLTARNRANDYVKTPYGELVAGVTLHAHMVSQLLSHILDEKRRPLLWVLPQWGEIGLIWIGALAGSILVVTCKSRIYLLVGTLSGIAIVFIAGFIWIGQALWLPVFPIALAFLLSARGLKQILEWIQHHCHIGNIMIRRTGK